MGTRTTSNKPTMDNTSNITEEVKDILLVSNKLSSSNTLPRESVTKLAAGTTRVTMGRVDKEETLVVPVALIGGDSS